MLRTPDLSTAFIRSATLPSARTAGLKFHRGHIRPLLEGHGRDFPHSDAVAVFFRDGVFGQGIVHQLIAASTVWPEGQRRRGKARTVLVQIPDAGRGNAVKAVIGAQNTAHARRIAVAVLPALHSDDHRVDEIPLAVEKPDQNIGRVELGVDIRRPVAVPRTSVVIAPLRLDFLPAFPPAQALPITAEDVVEYRFEFGAVGNRAASGGE